MRLELSSEGRYAFRALIYLARTNRRASADTIAVETGIPRRMLARILARLSRAGLVESFPGRGGGSRLSRPAAQITLRDVVQATEGPFGVSRCILLDRACRPTSPCALHDEWDEAQGAILRRLEGRNLAGFASDTVAPTAGAPRGGRSERGDANA